MVTLVSDLQRKKERTELVLNNIHNLPTLPQNLRETLEVLNDPEPSNYALCKAISKDQGLVTKILMIAITC